ncbi:MAG: hypothetical protein RL141_804 [Candidatus Parcubacteria bacterium]|jgi:hypothetical protein
MFVEKERSVKRYVKEGTGRASIARLEKTDGRRGAVDLIEPPAFLAGNNLRRTN